MDEEYLQDLFRRLDSSEATIKGIFLFILSNFN